MLEAIVSPEWEHRYYSFSSSWGPGEMMASMRNGSGDEYFILFDKHVPKWFRFAGDGRQGFSGAAIRGFDHEAMISPWRTDPPIIWPGMYDNVSADFTSFLNESAFSMADVTFCAWRRNGEAAWQCGITEFPAGPDPDGSEWMLSIWDGDPVTYQAFAREQCEVELPIEAIQHLYEHRLLTDEMIEALNRDRTVESAETDAVEIGYP